MLLSSGQSHPLSFLTLIPSPFTIPPYTAQMKNWLVFSAEHFSSQNPLQGLTCQAQPRPRCRRDGEKAGGDLTQPNYTEKTSSGPDVSFDST